MIRLRQQLIALCGVLALVAAVAAVSPVPSQGQGGTAPRPAQDVNVVNTPAVNVANTPTVNVANPVAAAQSGAWTVGLAGESEVHVANEAPIPVTVQNAGAREPFQKRFDLRFTNELPGATADVFTVPPGKRLVIEHFSASRRDRVIGLQLAGLSAFSCDEGAFVHIPAVTLPNAIVVQDKVLFHVGPGCLLRALGVINNHGEIPEGATLLVNGTVSGWLEDE